jgi:hypothetical protein
MFGVGALIAAIVSGGGWISGMITMDQGQIMQSIIDDPANTFPLLDNPSKAQFIWRNLARTIRRSERPLLRKV